MSDGSDINLLVLDMLKPHKPSILMFGEALKDIGDDCSVNLRVIEVDEKTESVEIIIKGKDLDFDKANAAITELGGTIHSIDEVCIGPTVVRSDQK